MIRTALCALAVFCLLSAAQGQTEVSPYKTMADAPDAHDFVAHAGDHLTLNGSRFRFGGSDSPWLGTTVDEPGRPPRLATDFETRDLLNATRGMGGLVIRSLTLASSVGCDACLMPSPGRTNEAAFRHLDQVLQRAHNAGIKLILPLADSLRNCGQQAPTDAGTCHFLTWQNRTDTASFYTDRKIIDAFKAFVTAVLSRINPLTGVAYREEPAILAWESCDGCGAGQDEKSLVAWTHEIGALVKSLDSHHLYESGAFAGRIDPKSATHASDAILGDDTVDILGDVRPAGASLDAVAAAGRVTAADKVYIVDDLDWTPKAFHASSDLEDYLEGIRLEPSVTGLLLSTVYAHAEQGGLLPSFKTGGDAFLFPGVASGAVSADEMRERARLYRRFCLHLAGSITIPMYMSPPAPEIISVENGKVTWRGSAGAIAYDVERSANPLEAGGWTKLCARCVNEPDFSWQDSAPSREARWYRVVPYNINLHVGVPSDPVQSH